MRIVERDAARQHLTQRPGSLRKVAARQAAQRIARRRQAEVAREIVGATARLGARFAEDDDLLPVIHELLHQRNDNVLT